jgi:ligand-binding sensor domain-containing protein
MWFGTNGAGVSRYDPVTGTWRTFTTANGLAGDNVSAIAAGPDGTMWFGTSGGLSRYDPATGAWQTLTTADGLLFDEVTDMTVAPDGPLFIIQGPSDQYPVLIRLLPAP